MLPFFGSAPVKHCERPVLGLAPYEEAVQTPERHEPSTVGANPTTQDTTAQDPHFKARTETQDYRQRTKGSPELCGPWPVRMVKTPERCVDGGTSGNRVDGGSCAGRVALGRMNTHLLNVVRHDVLPCWDVHTMKSYPSRRI